MWEVILGILAIVLPQVLTIMAKQGTTRKIGRMFSIFLRNTFGEKIENRIELTLLDIVIGAREDNGDSETAKQLIKSEERIKLSQTSRI